MTKRERAIARRFKHGTSVDTLARQFGRRIVERAIRRAFVAGVKR